MTDIVIVAEYCDATSNSTGFLVSELKKHLSDDFVVKVITPPRAVSRIGKLVARFAPLEKFLIALSLLFLARIHASKESHLLITTNPFFNWFTCRFFGGYRSRSILVFDFFPEALNVFGKTRLTSILLRVRNLLLPKFDNYFALSEDMCDYIRSFVGEHSKGKVHKVPLWVEPRLSRSKSLDQGTTATGKLSAVYFGNLGALTDVDELTSICDDTTNVLDVDVVGAGSMAEDLHLSLSNVRNFGGGVPFDQRVKTLSQYDCSIVIQPPALRRFAVPSKAFFSWEVGCPVMLFADPASELFQEIESRRELGIAVPYGSAKESQSVLIAEFIKSLSGARRFSVTNPCADYLMTCRRSSLDIFSSVFRT